MRAYRNFVVLKNCSHAIYGFTEAARAALSLSGTMLGYYPVKVLPSKTAIAPVNPTFLPRVKLLAEPCGAFHLHMLEF